MSEKNLFFSVLYDYYANLLKENQATVIDLYYNLDYSLSEIGEELGMSRAGVYDTLKRAENNLSEFEEKLCLHKKITQFYEIADNIIRTVNKIDDCKYSDELKYIKAEAEKILNEG